MKKYLDLFILIFFFVLVIGPITFLYNEETCMAGEFDAALNVMGYDRDVAIKINGIHISRITGGMSQSVRLFLADDPAINTLPPEMQSKMKELFCLKEGENTIEITFKEKGQPQIPGPITISIDSGNYQVPVLKYMKNPEVKEGRAVGKFSIYTDEPAGYTTVILDEADGKSATSGKEGEKTIDAQYAFDFPGLSDEYVRQNYVRVPYNIHTNNLFNFSVLMNKNWNAVRVQEPGELPLDGSLVDIGKFNLYWPPHDPNGEIKAQLIVSIAGIPTEMSAADYVDEKIPLMLKDQNMQVLHSKVTDTKLGPSKDILISYGSDNAVWMSRVVAFKVKDDTKSYLFGERDLLYLIMVSTQQEDYEKFGAEAFYMAKVTFYLD
jgi:hypothetical protein